MINNHSTPKKPIAQTYYTPQIRLKLTAAPVRLLLTPQRLQSPEGEQVGPRACSCRALLACDFPLWAYASNRRKATLRFSLSSWILWCDFLQLLCFLPSRFRYRSWIWIDLCFAIFVHWTGCSSTSLWRGVVICDHAIQTNVRLGRQAHFTGTGGGLKGGLS